MTAIFKSGHFTTQLELYIVQNENIITSYAISTNADVEDVLPLLNDNKVKNVIFYGQLGIYKKIEKKIRNNQPEVNILWQ